MRQRSYLGLMFCAYVAVLSTLFIRESLAPPVGSRVYDPPSRGLEIFIAMLLSILAFLVGNWIERSNPDHRRIARGFIELALLTILLGILLVLLTPAVHSHR